MPRRLHTLLYYGEVQHSIALMLLPLAIWVVDQAAVHRRWLFLAFAPFVLALVPLSNWTGSIGLMMAMIAYIAAKLGAKSRGERPLHWPTLIGIGTLAYALVSYWLPPSLLQVVRGGTVMMDVSSPTKLKASIVVALAAAIVGLHFVFQRLHLPTIFRFATFLALISGTVVALRTFFTVVLLPIGHRFQLEFELGFVIAVTFLAMALVARLPRFARAAVLILAIGAGAIQTHTFARYAARLSEPLDLTTTAEYKFAKWFDENMNGQRVLGPGTTGMWMNLFTETPQITGCCDQSVESFQFHTAHYMAYWAGPEAQGRDGEISVPWLKLYGVSAIGVMADGASMYGQPYYNPRKFDGVLAELWRDPAGVIYKVPRPNPSLAHVVPAAALVQRVPDHGLHLDPIQPLVAALDQPRMLASFRWISQHEAEIKAQTESGEAIYIQEQCAPGWRAFDGASELTVGCDPMNQMVLHPSVGSHTIRMTYMRPGENRYTRAAQIIALLALAGWVSWWRRRRIPA
jgi:hypothetical protein